MDALISGRAGVAIVLDDNRLASIHAEAPGDIIPRQAGELYLLVGDANDFDLLEDVGESEVTRHLELAQDREEALQLALILVDPDLSASIREEAAAALDHLLSDQHVTRELESVFYAQPMPSPADPAGALECCGAASATRAQDFFHRLNDRQPYVRAARGHWDAVPTAAFGNEQDRSRFDAVAVHQGLFRDFVDNRASGTSVDTFLVDAMLNPSIRALPNHRQVLQQWVAAFRTEVTPAPETRDQPEGAADVAARPKGHKPRRDGMDRKAIFGTIERQKEAIVRAMERGDVSLARNYTDHLVKYNLDHGGSEFACKSLCDLAMDAKRLGMHRLQLELTDRSINLRPEDGWSWAQHADALLKLGLLHEALEAYSRAQNFGQSAQAKKGRAEVLKALNRLDESLAAYEAIIEHHPEDVVAKTGRAEVLKALNRLDDSLAAYETTIAQHPQNVVARTGRAEVLKALNRLDESLAAYEATIAQHPENVVARTGRAEVLKALNRLDESLASYEAIIEHHPENVVPKNGRAEVLKALNRLDESLAAYETTIAQHPENVVARTGRAEVLKALNRLDESLAAYETTIAQHPENVVAKNGRACVLAALERWDDALAHLPEESPITKEDWIGYHVRGMILLRQGQVDDAIQIFEEGVTHNPCPSDRDYFRTALAVARLRKREYERACQALEEVTAPALHIPRDVLRVHAFGELGQSQLAAQTYHRLPPEPAPALVELQDELHRRYVAFEAPRHDEEWLFDSETRYLLLAA